jgi:hypothetical protein
MPGGTMRNILVLFIALFMFSAVNASAQTMSKYGYPSNYHPSKKTTATSNSGYPVGYAKNSKPPYQNYNKPKNYSINSVINSVNIYYENDYFHYGEYTPNLAGFYSASRPAGSYLDGEHAGMRGYGISFQNTISNYIPIWYKASYSYLSGTSMYDEPVGPTNISHTVNMTRYGFRLGYVFHIGRRLALIPNFGYQWVNWNRNITGLNSDYYHLNYYTIGLKAYYIPPVLNNKLWIEGEGYYLNDIHDVVNGTAPTTYTYQYSNGYTFVGAANNNTTHFIMTPKSGYIFGLKMGYQLYKIYNLSINPYIGVKFEQNQMGRSNINNINYTGYIINDSNNQIVANKQITESYLEPSDQYNQIFLQFGLKFGF